MSCIEDGEETQFFRLVEHKTVVVRAPCSAVSRDDLWGAACLHAASERVSGAGAGTADKLVTVTPGGKEGGRYS